jgi:hypothetical protein
LTTIRVRDDRDWRALWDGVIASSGVSPDVLPMNALCWGLEQLCRQGFELPRVVLFVQTIWQRYRRTLGDVRPRIAPSTDPPAGPPVGATKAERQKYERELEAEIEKAQRELEASRVAYASFCKLVDAARSRFGDAQAFLVNVLGWTLEVLYRRGYSDDELAALVIETWAVVEAQQSAPARSPYDSLDVLDELEGALPYRRPKNAPRSSSELRCPFCDASNPEQGARGGCRNCAKWHAAGRAFTETDTQPRRTTRTRR